MLLDYVISTNIQKVLRFLSLNHGKLCYEREIAKGAGVSYGSANSVLRKLHKDGLLERINNGRMCYYRLDVSGPFVKEYKMLVNISMLEPVVDKLKPFSRKVVLYGSWGEGNDTEESDIDLFVVSPDEAIVKKLSTNIQKRKRSQTKKYKLLFMSQQIC